MVNELKCKVMYFGKNNPHKEYHIQGRDDNFTLEATDVEKDLGIMVANNGKLVKWSVQVEKAVNKDSWVREE